MDTGYVYEMPIVDHRMGVFVLTRMWGATLRASLDVNTTRSMINLKEIELETVERQTYMKCFLNIN